MTSNIKKINYLYYWKSDPYFKEMQVKDMIKNKKGVVIFRK